MCVCLCVCILGNIHMFICVCTKAEKQGKSKVVGSGVALSVRNKPKLMMKNIQCKREKWTGETHTQCELPGKGVMKRNGISFCPTSDTTCKPSRPELRQCLQDRLPRNS